MTAVLLAFSSALAWGLSDFIGGVRARSAHFIWVTLVSQVVLTGGVVIWALALRPGTPTPAAIGWGMLAALGHVFGTLMLVRGLARGAMHVAGPLAAVVGASIPVLVGVVTGERPSGQAWVGIVLALPAVWLVAAGGSDADADDVTAGPGVPASLPGAASRATGRRPTRAGASDGVLAGLGFALFFTAIAQPDASAGGWPLVALEVTALVLLVGVAAVKRPPGRLRDARGAWVAGALAAAANILYYLATQAGMLSIVVVVASLYPAVTVAMAVLVLHERPNRRQAVGLALTAAAVALIALGG